MLAENLAARLPQHANSYESAPFKADDRPVSVLWANGMLEKEAVYKIRYAVYCERLGYENTTQNPDQMEMDLYDGWSRHLLIRDNRSARYVGTIRIVEPSQADQQIPIESHYNGNYLSPRLNPINRPTGQYVEFSRLAVDSNIAKSFSKQYSAEIARLLYLTAIAYFQQAEHLSHLFWLSEKWLARRLSMLGILSNQVGSYMEFRGQRAPFLMKKGLNGGCSNQFNKPALLALRHTTKEIYNKIIQTRLYLPDGV